MIPSHLRTAKTRLEELSNQFSPRLDIGWNSTAFLFLTRGLGEVTGAAQTLEVVEIIGQGSGR